LLPMPAGPPRRQEIMNALRPSKARAERVKARRLGGRAASPSPVLLTAASCGQERTPRFASPSAATVASRLTTFNRPVGPSLQAGKPAPESRWTPADAAPYPYNAHVSFLSTLKRRRRTHVPVDEPSVAAPPGPLELQALT